ncbi:uncharacterized protein LOC142527805 isoform X2 [Primulina tabacum]|uniref:uncharacterized protein LOC142527805 isoform X2 n=1 Tax=Primulina tabacum TaxID=48773 RepID=UPI003F59CD75
MPNYPKLELHAADSRLLGYLDSASLPSEPPDIRNWFSSYVYESNTLHGFQDFDASAEIFNEEEKKAKLDDIRVVDKVNDCLFAGKMEFLDGVVKCNESDELENSKRAAVISRLSDSDSLLLSSVSEPPDIRNWFSSYVYESNTLHGFQDFDASAGICNEEEKKAKLDDIRVVDKVNDGLLAGKMEFLDGVVKCNESDELENSKRADVISRLSDSDSLLLSSEPPDIWNWFSSYLYETPMLDTTDGFTFSDCKEGEESEACNAELASHSRISEVVKSIDLVKGSKQTYQTDSTDGQKLERNRIPHVPNELSSERISQHMLPEQKAQACSHHSVEECIKKNTDGKENNAKSDTTFMRRTTRSHTVVHVENDTSPQGGKYLPLIQTKDNSENSLSNKGDFGKENFETALPENGFVCTRNSGRRTDIESFTKPQRVQFQTLRKGVKHGPNPVENTNTRRNVLSETTNFPLTNALEITGKWCCPQRKKPNRGPPLKQVRLERWVRQV